ncbi:Uncharacterised protein [Clostridium putrefaciens]|uniref:Uncharacterized protein n=1 Tax=Clostridium putrefaciens TaxID=99675 RepID=A0A381J7B3_9CLOT|nr:Uncharacterised protein [Clostridium putrefaciens]
MLLPVDKLPSVRELSRIFTTNTLSKSYTGLKKVLIDAHYTGLKEDDINNIINELYDELINNKNNNITKGDII